MKVTSSTMDYRSHPAELVEGGVVKKNISIRELRNAIPDHCFKPSYLTSFSYLFTDLVNATVLALLALTFIPKMDSVLLRGVAWTAYGFVQGLVWTGLWVIGHECGHSAFSPNDRLNDLVGWLLHSALMTPYFSWKSTHRRHHIWANQLEKDHNYVPPRRDDYAKSLLFDVSRLEDLTDDAPIVTGLRILLQQLIGWPWYLLVNITAGAGSLHGEKSASFLGNSHLNPTGSLFRKDERFDIILSDIGLAITALCLCLAGQKLGLSTMLLVYFQPYMWVNHWIVAITYLHHTHPSLPKFEPEAWTFLKGATATIDRDFGFIGKHLFHGIIEFHVIHHLFSRMPFYHGEEATKAIMPLLGDQYRSEKHGFFLSGLWEAFTKCQWVEPDGATEKKDQAMWYKGGPSPPPEIKMGEYGWNPK